LLVAADTDAHTVEDVLTVRVVCAEAVSGGLCEDFADGVSVCVDVTVPAIVTVSDAVGECVVAALSLLDAVSDAVAHDDTLALPHELGEPLGTSLLVALSETDGTADALEDQLAAAVVDAELVVDARNVGRPEDVVDAELVASLDSVGDDEDD
jgi:hypothetical protein